MPPSAMPPIVRKPRREIPSQKLVSRAARPRIVSIKVTPSRNQRVSGERIHADRYVNQLQLLQSIGLGRGVIFREKAHGLQSVGFLSRNCSPSGNYLRAPALQFAGFKMTIILSAKGKQAMSLLFNRSSKRPAGMIGIACGVL